MLVQPLFSMAITKQADNLSNVSNPSFAQAAKRLASARLVKISKLLTSLLPPRFDIQPAYRINFTDALTLPRP